MPLFTFLEVFWLTLAATLEVAKSLPALNFNARDLATHVAEAITSLEKAKARLTVA